CARKGLLRRYVRGAMDYW
nr:immunoglobulin heavy chain junction region [Mus musculus]MBK4189823.1 immunoglobulin heavy chain junction region [Mus musculus]MBK4189824.1 immunoglobulin heavy chain junction region [Mus musculus]